MNIVFIGAGNVATRLGIELKNKSFRICQVYSRTIESSKELADKLNCEAINDISKINTEADIYIFSVKDSVLPTLIKEIPANKALWLHTAGSLPMDIFERYTENYGVIYPFQTFSKTREVNFEEIPVFIEANKEENYRTIKKIADSLSSKVYELSSEKRKYLHLTGVFACNFVNHMYYISNEIVQQQNLPFDVVLPLIQETAEKVKTMSPYSAQTGPAIRFDENVINKHIALLSDERLKDIYRLISENIHESYIKNNK